MQPVSKQFSHRIIIISNIAMFSVLLIHSNAILSIPDASFLSQFVHYLVCDCLCLWAVPFFFIVSGFFFGRHYANGKFSLPVYWQLLQTKKVSLLTPYLFWAVIGLFLFTPVICVNSIIRHIPISSVRFFGVDGHHYFLAVLSIFGVIAENGPFCNRPLWYVRSLILFFLLSPLYLPLLKKKSLFIVIAIGLALIGGEIRIPFVIWKLGSMGYFFLGMFLAVTDYQSFSDTNSRSIHTVFLFIGWVAFSLYVACCHFGIVKSHIVLVSFSQFLCVTFGVLFWWFAFFAYLKCMPPFIQKYYNDDDECKKFLTKTFWCYCMHLPVCRFFVSCFLFLFSKNTFSCLIALFVTPILTLIVCLWSAFFVKAHFPCLYHILNGKRE